MKSTIDPIRVVLVDDHPAIREGLTGMINHHDDMVVVGEAANGNDALTVCASTEPDIVLVDVVMEQFDGMAVMRALLDMDAPPRVVMLTGYLDAEVLRDALAAGASGFHLKNLSIDRLAEVIRDVSAGRTSLAPEATDALVASMRAPNHTHTVHIEPLTEREREVLALLVEGLSNPSIADRLHLGRSTVKYHVSKVLAKLGASSRTEAVVFAVRQGLVK